MRVRAELHCHTSFSDGFASPQACVQQAARAGLQVIAITDHNTAEGVLSYWKQPLQDEVLVIPGEEISTDAGHLLAYFVRETILPGRIDDVLDQILEQDALAFMAHPYHIPLGNSVRKKRIFGLRPDQLRRLSGIEVENGHNRALANRMAQEMAHKYRITGLAGSDAHFLWEIGNAGMDLEIAELSLPAVRRSMSEGTLSVNSRRFNAYGIYLISGLLNRFTGKNYAWKDR